MLEQEWLQLADLKDPLLPYRQKGWDRFQEIGWPSPKQEAFQYLSRKATLPPRALRKSAEGARTDGLCFVDGYFEESLSQIAAPLVCLPLDTAIRSYGLFLQNRFTRGLKEEKDPFAALNAAYQGRGIFLYVPPKCKAALHLTHRSVDSGMTTPRIHLYLGRGAQLHLEQHSEGKSGFSNHLLDFVLDEGSALTFIDRMEGDFQSIRATLKRDTQFKTVLLGQATRQSLYVQLSEENSEANLLGLAQLARAEEAHIHATVEHIAPHTRSRQHFKSVVKDQARFSFEGKILVRPAAQKTESYQLNNNLILSEEAIANAKPNLEIFADDVKASHGATVGQLDPEELFYLRSRGLSFEEAKRWLIEGFCQEILNHAR